MKNENLIDDISIVIKKYDIKINKYKKFRPLGIILSILVFFTLGFLMQKYGSKIIEVELKTILLCFCGLPAYFFGIGKVTKDKYIEDIKSAVEFAKAEEKLGSPIELKSPN